MKVHLRQRKQTKNGEISLYLEYYKGTIKTPEGKLKVLREYEYLNLYLIDKPKTEKEKETNKETIEKAEAIKVLREADILSGKYGLRNKALENANFIEFFKGLSEDRKEKSGNYGNWHSAYKHLLNYKGEKVKFTEIDESFCKGFKVYLQKTAKKTDGKSLSSNSIASYYSKFRASLKEAVRRKILLSNPSEGIETPKVIEKQREYLTFDELKQIVKAECRYDVLKRAFIFSCLTGLRWSDCNNLTWADVTLSSDGGRIVFNQQKTKGLQYLDISPQAVQYLGEKGAKNERVFIGLRYSDYMNVALSRWMLNAGITKHITFHCGRHTFAVLQLTYGTDIYTLQKLLGHNTIKNTQIYAQIIDEKKKEAVNRIPSIDL